MGILSQPITTHSIVIYAGAFCGAFNDGGDALINYLVLTQQ